ncbi:MAG TPA: hypothetical protein EYQ74_11715 [Planctomycetes bacterium]|nr:hypothetical protein [Planctomycetota bacterium]HIK61883.1 hypothetical protein [Planctomycetota bacterium]
MNRTSHKSLLALTLGFSLILVASSCSEEPGGNVQGSGSVPRQPQVNPPSEGNLQREPDKDPGHQGLNAHYREGEVVVTTNRGEDVMEGFQGTVHPVLHGGTQLEVTGEWDAISAGDNLRGRIRPELYQRIKEMSLAQESVTYEAEAFSAFLPVEFETLGHTWSIDLRGTKTFLKQFHPQPLVRLESFGRVIANNGGFATLRAISADYYDIMFRLHAEFRLSKGVWYTPAYLLGHVVIDRQNGRVAYFQMENPVDVSRTSHSSLNGHVTVRLDKETTYHDFLRTDPMWIAGGDASLIDSVAWEESIPLDETAHALGNQFFRFLNINWVSPLEALAIAEAEKKPIFAIVLEGALDDQTC